jgi:hypothetical protein
MGLAAYGMRDWNAAIDHFKTVLKEFPENPDAGIELDKAKQRLAESQTGQYDWKAIQLDIKSGKREIDIADYAGAIEVVDIPGKGNNLNNLLE